MKILVTGAKGFIGKNLIAQLRNVNAGKCKKYNFLDKVDIFECDVNTKKNEMDRYCQECDFVFHLAGINRPQNVAEFMEGNFGFTTELLDSLKKYGNTSPVLMSSSIQAKIDNDYGASKKAGEDYLIKYGKENNILTYIFRLSNVFGKWCRPNYNSAVATFCNNIANDLPVQVNSREHEITLVYIDDVVDNFIKSINGDVSLDDEGFAFVRTSHKVTLGTIVDHLYQFKESRKTLMVPDMSDVFVKKLYSTYLSYLSEDNFGYPLVMHADNRGSFTEFLHMGNGSQVSINISRPNIIKGQHWHNTKNEKFLVVSGKGVIRFRKIGESRVIEYFVNGETLEVVDIPVGYTHNIENLGTDDMVTIMWCSEIFDPNDPDTYFEEV